MGWTNPAAHIYAVGEVVTASTLNTYVEANIAFLGGPYYARAYQSGSAQTVANGTITTVVLNTIDFDPNSNFNTSTYTYTAPVDGRYLVTFGLKFSTMTGGIAAYIAINGTNKIRTGDAYASAYAPGVSGASVIQLHVGDTVTMKALQVAGGPLGLYLADGTGVNVYLSITCIAAL